MGRRLRIDPGEIVYHVINRRVGRETIFVDDGDYAAFEKVLQQACERIPMRILAYCLMPNHWHLLLWPTRDGQLRRFMQWLSVTHTHRWHAHRRTAGEGPLYQGRYRSFPVQEDAHLRTVAAYVERNALRARLVRRAENWPWCSLRRRLADRPAWLLSGEDWPVKLPGDWLDRVNRPEDERRLAKLRASVNRGAPFGEDRWRERMTRRLRLESSLRPPWRPKKSDAIGEKES